jgi:hypothetical protein
VEQSDPLGSLLVGKPEIAALAGVQRPVVTMWISRHRNRPEPFPSPIAGSAGRQLYRGSEVADWITAHGLGNNPALREDLALYAALDDAPPGQRAGRFDALTAMLCLKKHLGRALGDLPADEIAAAARTLDPDDRCLRSEIDAVGDHLPALARYVDLLADAAYDPAAAVETVLALWAREPGSDRRESALAPACEEFVGTVAAALLPGGDEAPGALLDPHPQAADLVLAVRRALPEHAEPTIALGGDDTPGARLARRRLLAHGIEPVELAGGVPPVRSGGGMRHGRGGRRAAAPAGTVVVTRLPLSGSNSPSRDTIAAASDVLATVPPDGRALILGPAAALCDPIPDTGVDLARWNLIRADRVRLIVRLPEGLLPARTGIALAIWVVGPSRDLAPGQRWMAVADLSGRDLDAATARAVADDALACLGDFGQAGRHAFQIARVVRSSDVIARGRLLPVPPPSVLPDRPSGAADLAVRAEQMLDHLAAAAAEPLAVPAVAMTLRHDGRQSLIPAAQLEADGQLRVLPGLRIRPEVIAATGEVTVLGAEEVLGTRATGSRRIDRIVFSTGYPRGRYTDPGDVVFTTAPRFGAVVDTEGSSVVLAPARILRITDARRSGLIPDVVARHLVRTAPGHRPAGAIRAGTGWRAWMLPVVDPATVPAVTEALAEMAGYRRRLADLLATVDDVADTVTAGLAAGTITVQPKVGGTEPESTDRTTGKKDR